MPYVYKTEGIGLQKAAPVAVHTHTAASNLVNGPSTALAAPRQFDPTAVGHHTASQPLSLSSPHSPSSHRVARLLTQLRPVLEADHTYSFFTMSSASAFGLSFQMKHRSIFSRPRGTPISGERHSEVISLFLRRTFMSGVGRAFLFSRSFTEYIPQRLG